MRFRRLNVENVGFNSCGVKLMLLKNQGRLIGFMGLPGSGKSSLIAFLAKKVAAKVFLEPEEEEWADCVKRRSEVGPFSGLQWFRSIRVPQLYEARRLADDGELVFLDSLYDKLCVKYLGKPGLEWVITPTDRYFEVAKMIATLDNTCLPDVDAIVSICVDETDYKRFLKIRNRTRDASLVKAWYTQEYFLNAAKDYAADHELQHLVFHNEFCTVMESGNRLFKQLATQGLLV